MKLTKLSISFIVLLLCCCKSNQEEKSGLQSYQDLGIVGAMKDVMQKGELDGKISLDTIKGKAHLYGIGPEEFLKGEILINNGKFFRSTVLSDSTMLVEQTEKVKAPFFVYATISEWEQIKLPETAKTIADLETFINKKTPDKKRPFGFKLRGTISEGLIHIQNLPPGTKVSSPKDAHQGQVDYTLKNEIVDIIGFFSTEHQGIFTHHDSYIHMHLITKDLSKMGHLDNVIFKNVVLFLPKL